VEDSFPLVDSRAVALDGQQLWAVRWIELPNDRLMETDADARGILIGIWHRSDPIDRCMNGDNGGSGPDIQFD